MLVNCQYYTSGKPRRTKVCSALHCALAFSLSLACLLLHSLRHCAACSCCRIYACTHALSNSLSVFVLRHSALVKLTHHASLLLCGTVFVQFLKSIRKGVYNNIYIIFFWVKGVFIFILDQKKIVNILSKAKLSSNFSFAPKSMLYFLAHILKNYTSSRDSLYIYYYIYSIFFIIMHIIFLF